MSGDGDDLDAGETVDGDPFADVGDGADGATHGFEPGPGPEAGDESDGVMGMLRSTNPPVSPGEVGRDLDIAEPWYNHFGAGFIKMSGSRGTEAWMHLLMGAALLSLQRSTESDESGDEFDGDLGPADEFNEQNAGGGEVFEGPQ